MDAPLKAKSGHQGTAMALAPLAHVLFSRIMRYDPHDPLWPDRDRFVLSNGHASILQYSMLFLTGFGLTLDDIEAFRSWESRTPGHPEVRHTPGVEVTTGPLGQGFANAVGHGHGRAPPAHHVRRRRDGPPHVRHRRRRVLHGGRQPRGRVARRPPAARQPDLRLRRQPRHDRRRHRAGPVRRRRQALRGLRLARRAPRRDRRRLRRAGGRDPRRDGGHATGRACSSCAATSPRRAPTSPTTPRPTATRSPPRTSPAPRP